MKSPVERSTDDLRQPEHAFLTTPSGDELIDADLRYLRELPWSESSIGPISTWSRELLVLINLAMLSPQPQLFLLGPDSIIIYNTAYGRLLYDHHPLYLGRPIGMNEALISNAPAISRIVDRATTRAKPANENHVTFFFKNEDRLQETFLSATMVKLPEPLQGYHATTYDTTATAVQLRRKESLKAIMDTCASANDMTNFWNTMLQGVSNEDGDISFALLYRAEVHTVYAAEADCQRHVVDGQNFTLHGKVGSEESAQPQQISLLSNEPYIRCMRESIRTGTPVLLSVKNGTLPKDWCKEARQRCYGDDALEAVIIPSIDAYGSEVHALLVMGISPRRPYDEDYSNWIHSVHQFFANSVMTIKLAEARAFDNNVKRVAAARAEQILAQQREAKLQAFSLNEAIEAKRQQENFIDVTSHEIRNPLGAVILSADSISVSLSQIQELVKQSVSAKLAIDPNSLTRLLEDITESVETITSCSLHQKRITDDILSLSKLDSNLIEICPSSIKLGSFMDNIVETFRVETGRANIAFGAKQDASIKFHDVDWIQADSGRIMQVMTNLLSNAIKFTATFDGAKSITVRVGASETKDVPIFNDLIMTKPLIDPNEKTNLFQGDIYLWFEVSDTGCGMSATERSKMFQRFSQASPKTYNKYGGSGLGLFISQKLVNLQGGNIGFNSETDQGTTFAFSICALRDKAPDVLTTRSTILPFKRASASDSLSMLLVEDNHVNQVVLAKQLRRAGYTVFTADDGQEAFDFLKSSRHWKGHGKSSDLPRVDFICMDIEMPIIDGMTCTKMIRQAQQDGDITNHIPIIAVTANARSEQLQAAIDVGMDDGISKPFRIDDLEKIIEKVVV
ncbi:hypothetical protein D6D20_08414 [Aureobasidium pullulans]|uniref:Histidine kinase HHK15p n=1 Tax=Aureobasidium pullulans TaxID=5580 RepID=A0A4V6TJK4_AURPU|nr:hypothetical protein D6D20_08414 [Aureobasidium pullulans]THZ91306.1 hypothetical protein D6C82_10038 [Aureobasidium pullulans]